MFPKKPTDKQIIGKIGEDCACEYLRNNGYKITDRNYLRKWGEIDIVAKKGENLHFIEVKSISRLIGESAVEADPSITHVTDGYRPEDNMHPWKLKRLSRVIQSYLLNKDISDDIDWQFDVATVYVDMSKRLSKVLVLEDVIL